ncbi:plexin domain-containing protein 2-like [Bolinopsis microptera]|uniref:plexin domain-containing protein 2-like n=1 Tax=Bolinopsis microptera TaxID=2820187 RepID=UPI003078E076
MIKFLLLLSSCASVIFTDPWYSVSYKGDLNHWIPLPANTTHEILSRSYLASTTSQSLFTFPFYNTTRDDNMTSSARDVITTTSSGFLYLGTFSEVPHTGVAGYIAPLMADFIPNPHSPPKISILSLDTVFVVEWRDMQLEHYHGNEQEPPAFFTFQCQLYPNGTILFLYQNIPVSLASLSSYNHPLEVGLKTAPQIPQSAHVEKELLVEMGRVVSGVSVVLSPNITGCCGEEVRLGRWCEMVALCGDLPAEEEYLTGEKKGPGNSSAGYSSDYKSSADKKKPWDSSQESGDDSDQAGSDWNVFVLMLAVMIFSVAMVISAIYLFYRYVMRGRRERVAPFKEVLLL